MKFVNQRRYQNEEANLREILTRQLTHTMDQEHFFFSHDELVSFFELYKNWRRLVKKLPRRHFEQDILHYLTQNFYWLRFPCSSVIGSLLKSLYHADRSFRILFLPDESCPFFSSVKASSEHPTPLEFFLLHAYKEKLVFNGMRMASVEVYYGSWKTPCELAVEIRSPALLKLLLRYGCLLNPGEDGPPRTRNGVIDRNEKHMKLLRVCVRTLFRLNPRWIPPDSLAPEHSREYRDIARCGRLLLRMCPHFKVQHLFRYWPGRRRLSVSQMCEYVEKLKGDLPMLPFRCVQPIDLQHACRLYVRQTLHNNWRLPMGVRQLDLPVIMQNYLDLQED